MAHWQTLLERWKTAGLIDEGTLGRIRDWEHEHGQTTRTELLALIAFGLGGLLLAAGVLLFVAAHWDDLSPAVRYALVLTMVGGFHGAAALISTHSPALSTTLHAVGTAALGAGIFLAGQIFNMAEHWPGALLLWAIGAAAALALLRDWPHVLWVAVLVPGWLAGEWIELSGRYWSAGWIPAAGGTLLSLVYLGARTPGRDPAWRIALTRLGGAALIPFAATLGFTVVHDSRFPPDIYTPYFKDVHTLNAVAKSIALFLPIVLAVLLRRRQGWFVLPMVLWTILLAALAPDPTHGEFVTYLLYVILSSGIAFWGVKEQRPLTINLGVLGFALTVGCFYFANLFDKLGRSLGLIGMGVLFIGGGWLLERTRRRLVGRIARRPA